jgi:hypothetical protein
VAPHAPGEGASSSEIKHPTDPIDFPLKLCYIPPMTKLEQIEKAIAALPHDDIVALADWFAEFHADLWDKPIAAEAGMLDIFAAKARAEITAGKVRPL